MKTTIIWTGIEYHSIEHCTVNTNNDGVTANSTIIGFYQNRIYRLDYIINMNALWQTKSCLIDFQCNEDRECFELINDLGVWHLNGEPRPDFSDCTDVDIPLTPFTNTLPIRRLNLMDGDERVIDIIYLDLMENEIKHVKQKYRRISANFYRYENIPNDFEANIEVDEDGFVVNYPQLFTRTAIK
jgi:hypothetical protein